MDVQPKTNPQELHDMATHSDSLFCDKERQIIDTYRNPRPSLNRALRISMQYAVGAAVFVYLAIATNNPYWSLAVYGIFVAWMVVRLVAARRLGQTVAIIIDKYDGRINELEELRKQ